MKKNSGDSGNLNLLKQFAVKSNSKTTIVYNDTAVIYNRCSSKKQDSLGWQDEYAAKFSSQLKLELVRSFNEKFSAKTDDRTVFNEMLAFCEKEKIGHIIFFSYDRFSRAGDVNLIKTLKQKGIRVHAATQHVDDETSSGRLSQAMYLMFAQYENEERRKKIIEGLRNKLRKGEWINNPAIGYKKDFVTGKREHPLDKPQCFIDETGKLIKQIFQWKDEENLTYREIRKRLIPMGVKLLEQQIAKILRNPFYCGYITHSLLDDGELIRGKHEPLISEELFLRVNGLLNGNTHGWKRISHADKMPFKASVKCQKCERPLTAYLQKEKYIYYKCPNKGCCVNVSSKNLQPLFESELVKYSFDLRLLPAIKSKLESTYWMLHKSEVTRVKPMKDELTRLKNELETMELNLATSKISPELFEKVAPAHQEKIKIIEAELEILTKDTSNFEIDLITSLRIAFNLLKMWHLLNCDGKVRLQKLVFPEGMLYDQENHILRTHIVNPIFAEIASISQNLVAKNALIPRPDNMISPLVYLRFPSSNFLWENLEETAVCFREIETDYPLIQVSLEKPVVSLTGSTEMRDYIYQSDTRISEPSFQNHKPYLSAATIFSGFTASR